jgi:hypothetical protein
MPGPDLSEFASLSRPKKRPCPISVALASLHSEEGAALAAAVAEDKHVITAGAIVAWLKRRNHSASVSGVTSHRHGTCTCA